MKKLIGLIGTLAAGLVFGIVAKADVNVYRLYNSNTGEHFYTTSVTERNANVIAGWNYEGTGWVAPSSSSQPVYRIYNPNAQGGDHYYTKSKFEAQQLVSKGWRWDNGGKPVFYSGGNARVFVAYNPNAGSGSHNYTTNKTEQNNLLGQGWKYGAVAWNAVANGKGVDQNESALVLLNALRSTSRRDVVSKGDGAPRAALTLDSDLNKWAQTRTNELVKQSSISHDDMYNGAPSWAVNSLFNSPNYVYGTVANGPECLAAAYYTSINTSYAIKNMWWNELYTGGSGYGHYLTLASPLANRIGFGIASANGFTVVVSEIAYRK